MKHILTLLLLILLTETFGEDSVIKQKIIIIKDNVEVEEIFEGFSDFASEYELVNNTDKKSFCYVTEIEKVCNEVTDFARESRKAYDEGTAMDLFDGASCEINGEDVHASYMLSNDEIHDPFFVERTIKKCINPVNL